MRRLIAVLLVLSVLVLGVAACSKNNVPTENAAKSAIMSQTNYDVSHLELKSYEEAEDGSEAKWVFWYDSECSPDITVLWDADHPHDFKVYVSDPEDSETDVTAASGTANTSATEPAGDTIDVGILFPDSSDLNTGTAEYLKSELENLGYSSEIRYSEGEDYAQSSKAAELLNMGCKVLIFKRKPADDASAVIIEAHAHGAVVISFEETPVCYSPEMDYLLAFNDYLIGEMQLKYIAEAASLQTAPHSFNVAIMALDPNNNDIESYYNGIMADLSHYVSIKTCVIDPERETVFDVGICQGDTGYEETARQVTEDLLSRSGLDICFCGNNEIARGVEAAFSGDLPYILSVSDDINDIKNMIDGGLTMSVYLDPCILAHQAALMTDQIMTGEWVNVNWQYELTLTLNGNEETKYIPAFYCEPVSVDASNLSDYI